MHADFIPTINKPGGIYSKAIILINSESAGLHEKHAGTNFIC
jgi:hypothetical protein